MLDNDILTLASVKDMVQYASEMKLDFDSTNKPNSNDQMETVQNVDSPANPSETEDNMDEDVRNNMILQINIVERNDGVLSEDEVNIFQDTGGSENFDNSLRVNENGETSLTNNGDFNCHEMNLSERTKAQLQSPSNFGSLETYSNSLLVKGYVNNRSATSQSDLNVAEVNPALEDSGVEYSDEEASYHEHFQRKFFSFEEELLLPKNRSSASPECSSALKEMEIDWHGGIDRLFYSV